METVGRFAPSPSGSVHLGNLFACLLAWLSVRSQGGRMVLRLEDLDEVRCKREYGEALMKLLRTLGLDWDEGPDVGGPNGPYIQSQRRERYEEALEKLEKKGLLYPCFCTRLELHAASAPHASDGRLLYAGTCRDLTAREIAERRKKRSPALRLRVPERVYGFVDLCRGPYRERLDRDCGDFLLRRSDGLFAYQLAVVADDGAMGITEVVRGADLLDSTPRQLYLYDLLELPPPTRWAHVPLLLSKDGRRLSKRDGDLAAEKLLERHTPEALLGKLAYLGGFHPGGAPVTARELVGEFSWEKVPGEDIIVEEGMF